MISEQHYLDCLSQAAPPNSPIVLVCDNGEAKNQLARSGYDDVVGTLVDSSMAANA